uniref:ATP-dependent Clp protease proteolytic subunit n=1 Tax=Lotharella vacuolata TaxID=74820 RepID=A0A0H5BJZ1_9EUKA|nr:clp protease [Lotharella vacuolata]BAS01679.1 clp protease [Lotharella vacuolata]
MLIKRMFKQFNIISDKKTNFLDNEKRHFLLKIDYKKFINYFDDFEEPLLSKKIIPLYGVFNDSLAETIIMKILYLDNLEEFSNTLLIINSPGGSVAAGLAILDVINYTQMCIDTTCIAMAASMGAFILAAGNLNGRSSFCNSRIMIHQPLGGAEGEADDIELQSNEILYYKLLLSNYLSEFTKKKLRTILSDTDRDFFMSSHEALNYGLIDLIIN